MANQITIKVVGDKEFTAKLKKLKGSLDNWPLEFNVIGRKLAEYFSSKPFASEGGIFGQVWASLAQSTAQGKSKQYPGKNILVRTGAMQDNFGFRNDSGRTLTIFNKTPYFPYHQSSAPRKKIPRRIMIGVNPEVKSIVRDELEAGVRRRIKNIM